MYSPQQGPQTSSPPHISINSGKRAQSVDRISETQSRDTSPLRHSSQIPEQTAASFLAYPVSRVAFSLYRRLTEDVSAYRKQSSLSNLPYNIETSNGDSGPIYVPHRTASPFTPPPLTRLTLRSHVSPKRQILSRGLAEEIRLLLPSRLQLSAEWTLIHSIETDGVSLTTLYERCAPYADGWHGFVLVVKDGTGGVSNCIRITVLANEKIDLRRISYRSSMS